MSDEADWSGAVIAGRYRLTSKLGQGGMGTVWRAVHLALGSEVAVKLIDSSFAANPEVRTRFVREAQAAAQLRGPHVVQILDYGVDGDTPFIAMELMVGETLSERLDLVGRLSPEDTARIVTEVSRALGKAHELGIVHRDLKPENIFLVHNDDTEIAKVLDFGVAKKTSFGTENAGMTSTGAVLGTPYYMSPEQAEGLKDLDHRTDIWALGVIAYECMVGVRPFDAETLGGLFLAICARPKPVPSLVLSGLPSGFDAWFEKCTARLLVDRFATAREAAATLRDVVAGQHVASTSPPPMASAEATLIGGTSPVAHLASGNITQPAPDITQAQLADTTDPNLSRTVGDLVTAVPKKPFPATLVVGMALLVAAGAGALVVLESGSEPPPEEALVAAPAPAPSLSDANPSTPSAALPPELPVVPRAVEPGPGIETTRAETPQIEVEPAPKTVPRAPEPAKTAVKSNRKPAATPVSTPPAPVTAPTTSPAAPAVTPPTVAKPIESKPSETKPSETPAKPAPSKPVPINLGI